jgi:hypothetical protein
VECIVLQSQIGLPAQTEASIWHRRTKALPYWPNLKPDNREVDFRGLVGVLNPLLSRCWWWWWFHDHVPVAHRHPTSTRWTISKHYECQKLENVVKVSLIRGRVEKVGIW